MEFLTDAEAASYGRYAGVPSQADLDRVFFLDDEDRALVDRRRGTHMRVGFALQLVTVRWLGVFLDEPLDVPGSVLDFVAGQLGVADPPQVKGYTERTKTRFDHQWEIRRVYGLREFTEVEAQFADWVAARGVDVRGRPESDLPRRDGVAAGAQGPAAGGDDTGAVNTYETRAHGVTTSRHNVKDMLHFTMSQIFDMGRVA